ncbi:hypothetical protein MSKU3_3221 [Komagataeibacter oboediens]|nr:hypothetical protein MSKU3_3221 [Komagataeibacter oboediens]
MMNFFLEIFLFSHRHLSELMQKQHRPCFWHIVSW